uniref:Polyribonucleotide 5'-hydroxyl-kinase Clp1 n=1 Tax=Cacopsylla melanoneura TaxID=428564 RepID=A0A8D9A2D8_9HEMI
MATLGPDDDSFELKQDQELRFEVENAPIEIEVTSGLAEIFGVELVKSKKYLFPIGAKGAVFTWHGCSITMKNARKNMTYVSKDTTPMNYYMNVHIILEKQRDEAEKDSKRGPITMIVGPQDVGKSTLCHILLNYAVRMPGLNRKPILIDLDVGQGQISVPGTLGALVIERPATIEDGFSMLAPIVYNFGHLTPTANMDLYQHCVERLWKSVDERMNKDAKTNASGIIINTCGWIKGDGFKCLLACAQRLRVDNILVLDQERLYQELKRDLPKTTDVVLLHKSGGVVDRTRQHRSESRDKRIKEYFYGSRLKPFNPHSFDVKFGEVQIYKIGAPVLPDSCMPLGVTAMEFLTKVVLVQPGE